MEIKHTYYACFKFRNGRTEKKKCDSRDEARKYISDNFDEEIHEQCWTE